MQASKGTRLAKPLTSKGLDTSRFESDCRHGWQARVAQFARANMRSDLVADQACVVHYLAVALPAEEDRSAVSELGIAY
jgi:hypothetical protein